MSVKSMRRGLEWEQPVGLVTGKYRWKTGMAVATAVREDFSMGKGAFLYPPAGELRSELVRRLTREGLLTPSSNVHVVADHARWERLLYNQNEVIDH